MTKSYRLNAIQVNFMLMVGGLLFALGSYFISVGQSPILLVMGALIVALCFVHRSRNVVVFKENSFSFAPTLFASKQMLYVEIDSVQTQRGKLIITSTGKVKEIKIGLHLFCKADRDEITEQLYGLMKHQ